MGWTQNFWKNSEKSWQMTMLAAAVKKRSRSDKSLKGRRRENNKTDYCPWPAAPASHRTEGVKADRLSVKTDRQGVKTDHLSVTIDRLSVTTDRLSVTLDHLSIMTDRLGVRTNLRRDKTDRQSGTIDRQSVNRPTEIGAIGRDRLTPGESRQTGAARLIRRGVRTLRKASMAPLKRRASCKK